MLLVGIATALGIKLLAAFRLNTRVEAFLYGAGLGLGILAYLTFFLGLLGLLYSWVIYPVLLVLAAGCGKELKTCWPIKLGRPQKVSIVLGLVLGLHLLFNFSGALAPPTTSDALAYHLALPRRYAVQHAIGYVPANLYAHWPATIEMLYLLGLLVHGEIAASLLNFFLGLLTAGTLYILARRYLHSTGALLAVTLFYASPLVTFESSATDVELGQAFFATLALCSFDTWRFQKENRWLFLSALFAGLCAASKLNGLFLILVLVLLLAFISRRAVLSQVVKRGMLFLSTAILVALPWYLKSWLMAGNPFWPWLFGGRDWNAFSAFISWVEHRQYGLGYDLKNLLLAPWNLTMRARSFGLGAGGFGPLLLTFVPVSIFLHPQAGFFLAYCGLFSLAWFWSSQQLRLLLPILPALALLAALTICRLSSFRALRPATVVILALGLLYSQTVNLTYNAQFWPVVFGWQSEESFLAAKLGFRYNAYEKLNQILPPAAKVLSNDRDCYYLERDYLWADPALQGVIDYAAYRSPEELLARLHDLGITHVFWFEDKETPLLPRIPKSTFVHQPEALTYSTLERYHHLKAHYFSLFDALEGRLVLIYRAQDKRIISRSANLWVEVEVSLYEVP